ncbi:hypothetical protein DSO57_1012454 [Entomophthora muscae]|uniref:Uncharacterized protein n=1 Tax=Entomophthora muscae TaxID=34485 RepID=A0ACC2S7Q9_9FUNG|nr:hypothetical protein DSO57_1012454 [Entomophthora muscae]
MALPDNRSFPKVTTCNTDSLGDKISNPANEKSPKPVPGLRCNTCPANPPNTIATNDHLPVPDARSFSNIPTCDTGGLGGNISKSANKNCPKSTQIVKQKGLKAYSAEIANGNLPNPDASLPKLKKPNQTMRPVVCQLSQKLSYPPATLPATYHSPGASFGPVHFTEYPLKPEYRDYSPEKILAQDPLAQSKELTRYNRKSP